MKNLLLIIYLLISSALFAQVNDDFSDGNFTIDPTWTGDTSKFIVNSNFHLQLNNAAVADEAFLALPAAISDSASWNFYFKMAFSPSATNYMKIYLQSDQQNLKGSLNGYFIKIGENGSNDAINLYEQTGATEKLIIQGIAGKAAVNPQFYIKVIRDNSGNWSIYSDTSGGGNFAFEGIGFSDKFTSGNYFGIVCKHTSSNSKKFYFDNVYIDPIFTDTIPPEIKGIVVKDNKNLEVQFSENVDSITAGTLSNFFLSNGIGNPTDAWRDSFNYQVVKLSFATPFQNKQHYLLTIFDMADAHQNIASKDSIAFQYFKPAFKDIVINEIMADPSPPVDLPEVEYVELYNNSGFDINLKNWKFTDATSTATLPDITIPADSFLILVSNSNITLFSGYGLVAGVPSLPSLNNSSDQLSLYDPEGNLIYQVTYSDQWYRDSKKKDGGWSLELIDVSNQCGDENNWMASMDNSGGTPGRRNSVFQSFDSTNISVKNIIAEADSILIEFNKSFNAATANNPQNFHIEKGITALAVQVIAGNKVILKLDQPLQEGIIYTIIIKDLFDCNGKVIDPLKSYPFSLPQNATFFDIIINEIMADSDPAVGLPAIEYIELYNRSNKTINLKQWKLSDGKEAVFPDVVMEAKNYLVVVAAGKELNFAQFGKVIGVSNWPSLNNDEDQLLLFNIKNELIHSVSYSDSWYGNKVKKDGGWSLEMIDPKNPCSGANNWSASKDKNGGTPGKQNSIFGENPDKKLPEIVSAYAADDTTIVVIFSEALLPSAVSVDNFHIKNGIGNLWEIIPFENDFKKIKIIINQPLQLKTIYELEISEVKDCAGNKINKSTIQFGLAEPAAPLDIIVNEILYNPDKGGVDFVEIYNSSNKIIDLKDLIIAKTTSDEEVIEYTPIQSEPFLILPEKYFALTPDPDLIRSTYFTADPSTIILSSKLPNFLDEEGGVAVLNKYIDVIDFVYYNSSWQHPLIDDHNGISLERIDFNVKSNEKSSWHSAATKVRATPGFKNSQSFLSTATSAAISVEPEVFSPDGDGNNDFLKIHYNFEEAGNIISISIYNVKGQLVRQLIKNEMVEQRGFLIWDGRQQDGEKTSSGIYIVLVEGFNPKGKTFSSKIKCVVGGIL